MYIRGDGLYYWQDHVENRRIPARVMKKDRKALGLGFYHFLPAVVLRKMHYPGRNFTRPF
jgi:hypothetical protein